MLVVVILVVVFNETVLRLVAGSTMIKVILCGPLRFFVWDNQDKVEEIPEGPTIIIPLLQSSPDLQIVTPPRLSVPLANRLVALYSITFTICARRSMPTNPQLTYCKRKVGHPLDQRTSSYTGVCSMNLLSSLWCT